jgi:hypothetical protein
MPIHMLYDRIQFISYQIKTDTAEYPHGRDRYVGRPLREASKDIRKRCKIMKNAIHLARNHRSVSRDKKTLKLFMAPEFYFRGGEGAYKHDHISEIFSEMRDLTKDKNKYGNWLFVMGTAVVAHESWWAPETNVATKEIWNVCLIQKGGFKRDDAGILRCCQLCGAPSPFTSSVIVYKEYVSRWDFVAEQHALNVNMPAGPDEEIFSGRVHGSRHRLAPVSGTPHTRVREIGPNVPAGPPDIGRNPPRHARGAGTEMSKTGLGGQSVFMIDGITFGIEVCLDHEEGRLRQSPPTSRQPIVQVHLIPSGGADINHANVVCMQNGYVFNVDGVNFHPHPRNEWGHTVLQRRTGAPLVAASFNDIPVHQTIPIRLTGMSRATVTHDRYFDDYGKLKIFQRQQLPPPRQQP